MQNSDNSKIKLVLYGNLGRKDISYFTKVLNARYEVAAYSYSRIALSKHCGIPFINLDDLDTNSFDYVIVMAENENESKQDYNELINRNIPRDKILCLHEYISVDRRDPLRSFLNSNKIFDGLFLVCHKNKMDL